MQKLKVNALLMCSTCHMLVEPMQTTCMLSGPLSFLWQQQACTSLRQPPQTAEVGQAEIEVKGLGHAELVERMARNRQI